MFGRVVTAAAAYATCAGTTVVIAFVGAAIVLVAIDRAHRRGFKIQATDSERRSTIQATDSERKSQADAPSPATTSPAPLNTPSPEDEHLRSTPEAAGWRLARELNGLKAYTRSDPGEFAFRIVGKHTGSTPAQWVVLFRELDLLPEWLSICDTGSVLRLASPTELWPLATFKFPWFWMLPPLFVLLHVRMQEKAPGEWIFTCATDESYDRTTLPPSTASYGEVSLGLAVARLVAVDAAMSESDGRMGTMGTTTTARTTTARTTTTVDAVFKIPIAKLTFLGPARHAMANAPSWLVTLAASVVIPFLWSAFIETLTSKVLSSSEPTNRWRVRLREDASGLYRLMLRKK